MAKNLKLNIKNTQIAEAINLSGLKGKLAKKKEADAAENKLVASKSAPHKPKAEGEELPKEEAPRIRARSKSAFAEPHSEPISKESFEHVEHVTEPEELVAQEAIAEPQEEPTRRKTSAELRQEIFGVQKPPVSEPKPIKEAEIESSGGTSSIVATPPPSLFKEEPKKEVGTSTHPIAHKKGEPRVIPREIAPQDRLGPTGRHIKDYLRPPKPAVTPIARPSSPPPAPPKESSLESKDKLKPKPPKAKAPEGVKLGEEDKQIKESKQQNLKNFATLSRHVVKRQSNLMPAIGKVCALQMKTNNGADVVANR